MKKTHIYIYIYIYILIEYPDSIIQNNSADEIAS